jgi:hypothetical protein
MKGVGGKGPQAARKRDAARALAKPEIARPALT